MRQENDALFGMLDVPLDLRFCRLIHQVFDIDCRAKGIKSSRPEGQPRIEISDFYDITGSARLEVRFITKAFRQTDGQATFKFRSRTGTVFYLRG